MPAISDGALAVKALARQHQEAIWALHQTTGRLRSVLLKFYPQALQAFPNLKHKAALTVLRTAHTPELGMKLTARKVVVLLHSCGRRDDSDLVEQILTNLKTPALRQSGPVEAALGLTVVGLIGIITVMQSAVEALETSLGKEFDQHAVAPVLRFAPGLGPVLAARVLAEIGDDPTRFTTAAGLRAFAGTAPVTRASGKRNKRLGDECHWWAFAMLTKSPGARAHYEPAPSGRRSPQRRAWFRRRWVPPSSWGSGARGRRVDPCRSGGRVVTRIVTRRGVGVMRRCARRVRRAARWGLFVFDTSCFRTPPAWLRNLANKVPGRMWWCPQNNQLWDEATAWTNCDTNDQRAAA